VTIEPEELARWSPLRSADTPTGAKKAGEALASWTPKAGVADGMDFWTEQGKVLFTGLLGAAALSEQRSMRDVAECLADGHSTAGSPGTGMGAIRRLSDEFDIYSQVDRGTIVFARLRARRFSPGIRRAFDVAGESVALSGEEFCGDAWHAWYQQFGSVLILADGLGHGVHASEAAAAAIDAANSRPFPGTAATLEEIHGAIRHTRGAAATIVELCRGQPIVKLAGVGNVATSIHANGAVRQGVSLNGTLGHQVRQFREYSYPWSSDGLLVMHSDGLASHWSLDDYHGLKQRHPAVVAAALYRDHSRHRDDVTVIVCKEAS
jgi:hypothetical protein